MLRGVEYLFEGNIVFGVVIVVYGSVKREWQLVILGVLYGGLYLSLYLTGLRRGWFSR